MEWGVSEAFRQSQLKSIKSTHYTVTASEIVCESKSHVLLGGFIPWKGNMWWYGIILHSINGNWQELKPPFTFTCFATSNQRPKKNGWFVWEYGAPNRKVYDPCPHSNCHSGLYCVGYPPFSDTLIYHRYGTYCLFSWVSLWPIHIPQRKAHYDPPLWSSHQRSANSFSSHPKLPGFCLLRASSWVLMQIQKPKWWWSSSSFLRRLGRWEHDPTELGGIFRMGFQQAMFDEIWLGYTYYTTYYVHIR